MSTTRSHWDQVYREKASNEVSWYQPVATTSMELITAYSAPTASVLNCGGGASVLEANLLQAGYHDVTTVDISAQALERVRLEHERGGGVRTIRADVTSWQPTRTFDVWHDRAVFHFFTTEHERNGYRNALSMGVAIGGIVVIGTFAADGPEQCSGLPVVRYESAALLDELGMAVSLERTVREVHHTPWGSEQAFTWIVARRLA